MKTVGKALLWSIIFTAIGISRRCSASSSNWTRSTYIYTGFNWNSGWKELKR